MIWCHYKSMAIASIVILFLLADAAGWLVNRSPNTDCLPEASTPQSGTKTHASKTVVQPWRGLHHVYGLFLVPSQSLEIKRYAVTISVEDALYYCMWVEKSLRHAIEVNCAETSGVNCVESGGYLRQYVPTRVAVWFLIHGLIGDLRNPKNWALVFSDQRS